MSKSGSSSVSDFRFLTPRPEGDWDNVIPSVFVGFTDGIKLMKHYTYEEGNGTFVVRLTDNQSFAFLLPLAILVAICLTIKICLMPYIICVLEDRQERRRERGRRGAGRRGAGRRERLPKSCLRKIIIKKFVMGDEEHYETCCICLDDYKVGDKLRILPCNHAYHVKCIDPWLLKNKRVCPQCRKVLTSREVLPSII